MKAVLYFIFLLPMFADTAFGYLHNQTLNNTNIHWPITTSVIDVYINSQNSLGLIETDVQSIGQNSVSEWNGLSRITLRKNSTTGKNQAGFNEIYFSTDPNFFGGSAVKGVTQVSYKQDTGEILEADILIDDTLSIFSTTLTDFNFLGNVVTHELGHLLGLGHGQVLGSTMLYEMSFGQSQLSDDDKAGVFSNYPIASSIKKTISGQVIGGKNLTPVYGAQVQAISVKTGLVAAAGISDVSGRFYIDGLAVGDQYFLYTKGLAQIGLPSNYANIKSDFCESSKNYRGSFFQSCGASGEGYPQAVTVTNANVDVGQITIRCGLDVPPEYIQQKGVTSPGFSLAVLDNLTVGNAFVGYFSPQELSKTVIVPDLFKINLSNIANTTWSNYSPDTLYLEIKILNQILFSPFKASVLIARPGGSANPVAVNGIDGFLNLDIISHVAIDRVNMSENDFTIQITPQKNITSISNYFPAMTHFQDSMYFYLATVTLVKSTDGGATYAPVSFKNYQVSDNARCPDAHNTYSLTNYNTQGGGTATNSNQKKFFICGSVDMSNGEDGSGPKGFFVGLTLCYIIAHFRRQFRQRL